MVTRFRPRHRAVLKSDIRQLRLALGMSVVEAAALLRDDPALLQSQEQGGRGIDRTFIFDCVRCYASEAAARARHGTYPPVADDRGTPTVYRMRIGLGLELQGSARILRLPIEQVLALEQGRRPLPDERRFSAWGAYADWANRYFVRQDRYLAARPQPLSFAHLRNKSFSTDDEAQIRRLAYTPPMTREQAETRIRKLLGLEP